jgi:hypothetical protein
MAHSVRGKVDATHEGPRYCASCHLTTEGLANYGAVYDDFRTKMAAGDFGGLDFQLLKQHFGMNTNNQMDSPLWAHMAAGLGTGLFLFDQNGAAVNPLDNNPNRVGSDGIAPASVFDPANVAFDLDRLVDANGVSTGSNNHTWMTPGVGPSLRDGAQDPNLAGPLGATLIRKLSDPVNGIVLDSWIDSNGQLAGDAPNFINGP